MLDKVEGVDTSAKIPTRTQNIKLSKAYQAITPRAREKAVQRIAKRLSDMPKVYRSNYDRAISGQSLRAAINAQCLECVYWKRVEIRLCPSYSCPLWCYRPYQLNNNDSSISVSKTPSEEPDSITESNESENEGNGAG